MSRTRLFNNLSLSIISLLLLFSGYLYITPYLSILSLKNAIDNKDILKANKYINYPSVRKSIQKEVEKEVLKVLREQYSVRNISQIEKVIFKPVITSLSKLMIEATVNPNGLNLLVNNGTFSSSLNNRQDRVNKALAPSLYQNGSSQHKKQPRKETKIIMYYEDPFNFILKSDIKNSKKIVITKWKREALISWKLFSINIRNY